MLFRNLDLGVSDPTGEEDRRQMMAIMTAAIRGSDAYAAVRRACKVEEGTLRVGNRFVRRSKVKEVAFLAVGNCAAAMARGFHDALGDVVTQGLVVGPEAPPDPWPFLFREVVDPTLPTLAGAAAAAEALELAQGLGKSDLFVPLISPGTLGMLASAPSGMSPEEYRALLGRVAASPTALRDLPKVAAALSPAQGGRLAAATKGATVEALLVARGEGGTWVGAGPTVAPATDAWAHAREALRRLSLFDTLPLGVRERFASPDTRQGPDPSRVHNVVVASPADALETSGAEAAEQKHRPKLVALYDDSPPEAAADHLVAALEEQAPHLPSDPGEGIALFSGLSLGVPEGGENREVLARFLSRAHAGLHRRGALVAVLSTVGSVREAATPSGGFVGAETPFSSSGFVEKAPNVFDLTPGFTDVGALGLVYLTRPLPPGPPAKGRRRWMGGATPSGPTGGP